MSNRISGNLRSAQDDGRFGRLSGSMSPFGHFSGLQK
jgi:hypothetical protein